MIRQREREISSTQDEHTNEHSKANNAINIEKDNLELGWYIHLPLQIKPVSSHFFNPSMVAYPLKGYLNNLRVCVCVYVGVSVCV